MPVCLSSAQLTDRDALQVGFLHHGGERIWRPVWLGAAAVRIRRQGPYGKDLEERGCVFVQALVLGATAVIRYCRNKRQFAAINALLQRRPARVVIRGRQQDGKDRVGGDEQRRDVPPGSLRHRISGSSRKGKES